MHFAVLINLGFNDRRNEAGERRLRADTATGPRWQWLTPAGFLGNELERRLQPRRLVEHANTECDWIDAGLARQLIHEALSGKDIVVWPHTAPKSGRHRRRLGADIFDLEMRNVVGIVDRTIDGIDIDAINKYRRRPARHDRRA